MDTAVLYESYNITMDSSMKWHFYIGINTCKKTLSDILDEIEKN